MNVTYDFSNRTVMVVGAASGIGRATALACLDLGARVEAFDVDALGLESLGKTGCHTTVVDISDSAAVNSAVARSVEGAGRIDAAILTSAVQKRQLIEETPDAVWQRHLDVNLSGVFYLLRAILPVMKRQNSGSVIAFTSGLASNGWPGAAAYAASKAGIIGLVKSAALEMRSHGVRVNAVSPGLVATPVFLESATEDELAMYERSLGISTPDEVVPTLLHLISDGASTVSGNVVERRLVPRPANTAS